MKGAVDDTSARQWGHERVCEKSVTSPKPKKPHHAQPLNHAGPAEAVTGVSCDVGPLRPTRTGLQPAERL